MSLAGIATAAHAEPTTAPGSQAGAERAGRIASYNDVLQGKPMQVKFGNVGTEYVIADPRAKVTTATRVVNPAVPSFNVVRDVYSSVVVQTHDEQTLTRALNTAGEQLGLAEGKGLTHRPYADMTDIFVVETPTVEDAINLANRLGQLGEIEWAEVSSRSPLKNLSMGSPTIPADPSAAYQWHIFNDPALNPAPNDGNHMIDLVYARGYTGAGVTVGVLEAFENSFYNVDNGGVLQIHPDLALQTNYDLSRTTSAFQIDFSHGVSVAGLIGAQGNNGLYGAGVAYESTLASLRNGSNIDTGESLAWELNRIDIINNSWGPVNEALPPNAIGKVLVTAPDDFEIVPPQVTSSNFSPYVATSMDRGIRLGRNRDGRVYVFAAGNASHFQDFARLSLGNAISLPGIGTDPMIPAYGYLDIWSTNPDEDGNGNPDDNQDGIPDSFILDGAPDDGAMPTPNPALGWTWSGHMGDRTEYNPYTSLTRSIAIGAVGKNRVRTGYSTTGTAVFASAYSQTATLNRTFEPGSTDGWGRWTSPDSEGLVTLEQPDSTDGDEEILGPGVTCNVLIPGIAFADGDLETCTFNGTSAAAPVASGIIALMLDANPALTLRDIQMIIQQTATVPETGPSDPTGADFYDETKTYWPITIFDGLGQADPDGEPTVPTFWTTNSADVRHSDEYGFGIIDADAAVQLAETWPGVGRLILLDSGLKTAGDDDDGGNPFFDDATIEDATFEEVLEVSENLVTNRLVPGPQYSLQLACVRDNIQVEGVELDLTIEGDGAGDLFIALVSPRGTVSPLALPRGDSNGLSGVAYNNHTFGTYKHWGEIAGGTWRLIIQDFRPDDDSPEGEPPDEMPDPMDPASFGVEYVTFLGPFGMPGNPDHSEKELVSYRLRIYGHNIDAPVFDGCPPALTGCPGDLDGNGIVTISDLQIFVNWWLTFDSRADINGDGNINYDDVLAFLQLWTPGYCNGGGLGGGRPRPGGTTVGDGDPVVRPI